MVVSMTEKTINDQLTHLLKLGVIRSSFSLYQELTEDDQFAYHVVDSWEQIPKDANGEPLWPCVSGQIHPQVVMAQSGTNITFLLKFRAGSAYFWSGVGPRARLKRYEMKGWQYGISIGLDLAKIARDDINRKIAVPKIVDDQLNHFIDDMFTVNSLFMDFQSTNLLKFDPAHTSSQGAGDPILDQFITFMAFYLTNLQRTGNPYILGYAITTNDQSRIPDDQRVPDSLRPVGTTFSIFHDTERQERSNLNFLLATKGGHGRVTGSPVTFDTNWIGPTEQCDAKMIYSHSVLLEHLFLKPLFEEMSTKVYEQIKGKINVPRGNSYAEAKRLLPGASGFEYIASNVETGNDQYVNRYTVRFTTSPSRVDITFQGRLSFYKEDGTNMGFCTARAWASGSFKWSSTISIITDVDGQSAPRLKTTHSFKIDEQTQNSGQNDCAKAFSWIGKIVGTILTIFTGFAGGFLGRLFEELLSIKTPGIGKPEVVLRNLGKAGPGAIMLPAGQVFFFKNPSLDSEGNFALQLTYKSENL